MIDINEDLTLHLKHREPNPNCEQCDEKVLKIAQRWYLENWITYKQYLALTGLPF